MNEARVAHVSRRVEHVSTGACVCSIRQGAAVACVAAYECRLFRSSNGESVGVVTIDEPNRVVPCLVLPLGDAVIVCSEQGTEALRFSNEGTLANRVVTSKVFDCAARLGDRCLGAGPAGAALVKFLEDAASRATSSSRPAATIRPPSIDAQQKRFTT